MSTDQLLKAVEQLPERDLDKFVDRVVALRAERRSKAPRLSEAESELFLQINRGLPSEKQKRLEELTARLKDERLSPAEHQELIALTDEIERLNLERLESLVELARLRSVPLETLMKQLGIATPAYE
jgi:hypothetical protein